jgi:histidinol dehydrogenase
MIGITDLTGGSKADLLHKLAGRERGIPEDVRKTAAAIVYDVRSRGDEALLEYTERFDGVKLEADGLLVTGQEIEEAIKTVPADVFYADWI